MVYQAYSNILYTEVNLIGVVFAALILFHTHTKASALGRVSIHYFRWMLLSNILTLLMDTAILLMRGHATPAGLTLTHVFCILFFLSQSFFGYSWARYSIEVLFPGKKLGRLRQLLLLLPALAAAIITAASPWTGWVYQLRADNHYMRGPLLYLGLALLYSYWVFGFVLLLQTRAYKYKGNGATFYRALLLFPLPVLVGNVLQMMFYGLSIGWICTVFSLLLIFVNVQTNDGSIDGMTGLWTQPYAVTTLDKRLKRAQAPIFVMMIDIDEFKSINDQYGHLTGNRSLKYMADLLSETFRKKDCVCRYGGDEFLIFGEVGPAGELEAAKTRLRSALARHNEEIALELPLSVSIGTAVCEAGEEMTAEMMIEQADRDMYRDKQQKKTDVC